ncbi:hypothetical protein J5J83_05490 [Azoarcus sp. L1K30]|uniref:hypothetical protein n=1 Tax=Azoarcus sp. L1K30 TaxID=2820277 RepID=UPI001B81A53D|nr:hypothetical protein [Azoarcus sp. L1K30]MBR0565568.1 hypothetical protein [Azoarcus sp. L1K30]
MEYRINEELMTKGIWIQDSARATSVKGARIEVSNHKRVNSSHADRTIPANNQGIVSLDTIKPGTYNLRVIAQWHEPLSLIKVEITKDAIQFSETRMEP